MAAFQAEAAEYIMIALLIFTTVITFPIGGGVAEGITAALIAKGIAAGLGAKLLGGLCAALIIGGAMTAITDTPEIFGDPDLNTMLNNAVTNAALNPFMLCLIVPLPFDCPI